MHILQSIAHTLPGSSDLLYMRAVSRRRVAEGSVAEGGIAEERRTEERRRGKERRGKERRRQAQVKSNDPNTTGGEQAKATI